MKTKKLACLSLIPLTVSAVCFAATRPDARFEDKEHLSSLQLYKMGYPAKALKENVGKFVTLDVVVTVEREVPLVAITIPQELKVGENAVRHPISAHLVSASPKFHRLKKGNKVKIEGMIVNEGYGAYFIYLHNVLHRENIPK